MATEINDGELKKSIIARTLRMTGTVCFIGIAANSHQYFQDLPPHTSPLQALPLPILFSMGMSVLIALGGQFWLWKSSRKRKRS